MEAVSDLPVVRPAADGLLVGGFLLFGVVKDLLGEGATVFSFSNLDGGAGLLGGLVLLLAI